MSYELGNGGISIYRLHVVRLFVSLFFFTILSVAWESNLHAQTGDIGSEFLEDGPDAGNSLKPQFRQRSLKLPRKEEFFDSGKRIFPKNFQLPDRDPRSVELDSRTQAEGDYPVGPGDQFLINFWGKIDDNLIVSIDSEHKLFIPKVGAIDTRDKTYSELQVEITAAIGKALKGVQFTVALYRPRSFQIYVLGSVERPGPYTASAKMRASDLIASAGGVLPTGSKQFIEVRRRGGSLRLDLLQFATSADFVTNPLVTDFDVIFVPPLDQFVTVSGAVVRPGTFEIKETKLLTEILRQMGGLSTHADRLAPIKISRLEASGQRRLILVEMLPELASKNGRPLLTETELKYGDEIFVSSSELLIPSQNNSVFVTGSVKIPGGKPYKPATPVDEYLGMAGGLTDRANLVGAVIYRSDGSIVPVGPRTSIEPGDTIYVPERTFKFWQDHLAIVTTFISLATSIIVLSGR